MQTRRVAFGLAVAQHRIPGIETAEPDDFGRRVHVATYGEASDLTATNAFVQAVVERRGDCEGPSHPRILT
jgi:hypothetical protein